MDGYQRSNLDLHLRATAAALNGMHGPPDDRRSKSRIEADIWAMMGIDFYRVNPTSKTHRSGFNLVSFAFSLADFIAIDVGRLPSHPPAMAFLNGADAAKSVASLLGQLYPADHITSVAKLTDLIRRRRRSNL